MWQALSDQVLNMDASYTEAFETRRSERISGETPRQVPHPRNQSRGNRGHHNIQRRVNFDQSQFLGVSIDTQNLTNHNIQAFRRAFNRQLTDESPMSFNQMARLWFGARNQGANNNRGCRQGAAQAAYHRERVYQERRIQLQGSAQQRMNQLMQAGDGLVIDRINNRYRNNQAPNDF